MHHLQNLQTDPANNLVRITNSANYILRFNNSLIIELVNLFIGGIVYGFTGTCQLHSKNSSHQIPKFSNFD